MMDECESLKREINKLKSDKLDLETTVDDLKRTLKLTDKESQVGENKFDCPVKFESIRFL